ncbi:integral membrane protein [Colletotrichum scovillei]|uniref:Integral membrane protein n=1 Tax=Colletotrichum scovillei TaxID=1209932 RepID=A0A9P7R2L0_9PEZI|nr:integral membrane protein [Colletotrichum scovillei]KAG7065548.1 integral membrane protein [Colletotrichum scovillei]KAG7068148.1 integral membrane protein [Colletotrichum scovillei]
MVVGIQPDPPFYALTGDDQAALVVVASLIFLIYAIVGISLKLIIRLNITSLKSHDVILLAATGLLLSQTVCIIIACNHGLGHHQDVVELYDLEAFHELFYVSSLLAIAIAASTKISLCLLIHSINNHGRLNLANKVLFGAIVSWGISGIMTTTFQCSLPQPWLATAGEKCPGREGIFLYNGVMDILTDVCLCLLPVAMMWKVQTTLKRKAMVVALFTTRII